MTVIPETEFAFARTSKVQNAGEDLANAARHRANEWRTLVEAEKDGSAVLMVKRDQLLKSKPINLLEGLTDSNAFVRYVALLILKAFPATPHKRIPHRTYKKTEAEARELYYQAYIDLKEMLERKLQQTDRYDWLMTAAQEWASAQVRTLREDDYYSPLANDMIRFSRRVRPYSGRQKANSVGATLTKFFLALQSKDLDVSVDRAAVRPYIEQLIKGKAFNKVFDVEAATPTKPKEFQAVDTYFTFIQREGGRSFETYNQALILEQFNLRGLQFGNYVPDKERLKHLAHVAEALADLADMTGVPDTHIGLLIDDRHMGLAIGARGKGTALAHYEPVQHVINLTRAGGYGSLAHEWWHAIDHMWSRQETREKEGGKLRYLSQNANRFRQYGAIATTTSETDPMLHAMLELLASMAASGYDQRLKKVVDEMVKEKRMPLKKMGYWTSEIERTARAFERWIQFQLKSVQRRNTYLSGNSGHKLWMTEEEVEYVSPAFEKLFKTYQALTQG